MLFTDPGHQPDKKDPLGWQDEQNQETPKKLAKPVLTEQDRALLADIDAMLEDAHKASLASDETAEAA